MKGWGPVNEWDRPSVTYGKLWRDLVGYMGLTENSFETSQIDYSADPFPFYRQRLPACLTYTVEVTEL